MTKKKKQILKLVYKYRFLTCKQVQNLIHHKYHSRVNTWLKELTKDKYLKKYRNPKIVINPSIYSLGLEAKKYFKKSDENINIKVLERIWREDKLSINFRSHCLSIVDIFILLEKQCKERVSKLHFYTKADLYGMESLIKPHPDAYIAIENDKEVKRYFLDLFDQMVPRIIFKKRINQFIEYYEDEIWQEETGNEFPTILLISEDQTVLNYLERYINKVLDDDYPQFIVSKKIPAAI